MPRSGRRAATRRRALPAAVALLGLTAGVPTARAELVFTRQAAAADAADSTWIPAPAQRAAVCVVDTGVGNAGVDNKDLANVVARLAIDGGDPDDVDATGHHGTLMAMIASAPYDGFGMVGAAPSVNVVSVRAMRPGQGGFFFGDVLNGIDLCRQWRVKYGIKVISLSLAAQGTLDTTTQVAIKNSIDSARGLGLDVVAAAGNRAGAVEYPAAYGPVVAVGAADDSGGQCTFSTSGPQLDLWASGCPQDVSTPDGRAGWVSGTSGATAFVSAALAQLRALRPDLTPDGAEALLASTARPSSAGPLIDVAAAFRAAGLDAALADGHAAIPRNPEPATEAVSVAPEAPAAAPPVRPEPVPPSPPSVGAGLPRPRLRAVSWTHGVLRLELDAEPAGVRTDIVVYAVGRGQQMPHVARRVSAVTSRVRTRVSGRITQVTMTYRELSAPRERSETLIWRPARARR